jgi:predicted phosphodiesterase
VLLTPTAALVTDVHGNVAALEAVLQRVDELGIERVYCGGDLVGYGAHPNEVCDLIRGRKIPTIHGNYDYAIGRDELDCGCAYTTVRDRELGRRSVAWTLAHTTPESKAYLRGLPFDLRFELGPDTVHLVHGSPRKRNEYLFEDKSDRLFERLAAGSTAAGDSVLAFGHTHRPWIRRVAGVLLVNCGAVGKPKDGDPRAAFAVLERDAGALRARIERVPYDVEASADAVRRAGLPPEYADALLTGS